MPRRILTMAAIALACWTSLACRKATPTETQEPDSLKFVVGRVLVGGAPATNQAIAVHVRLDDWLSPSFVSQALVDSATGTYIIDSYGCVAGAEARLFAGAYGFGNDAALDTTGPQLWVTTPVASCFDTVRAADIIFP